MRSDQLNDQAELLEMIFGMGWTQKEEGQA
jgi:hypothetical protein